ncbi:hypothetical protein LX16_2603 [Stackebrandtia albiflava]|uniref:Uncharacterized protein n=1 Tax=Stackebrandtia albiflava TaxID=406432 RepID=A0A562V1T3_9ACTN|nr:hypothetical protein [Stackebrandtia albiflava]TWJ11866.1 hypothetical protein LX16_2603 [Stackebrandtia albiflava]
MRIIDGIRRTADRALDGILRQGNAEARECDCKRITPRTWYKNCVVNGRVVTIGVYPSYNACILA